ncbi:MAG: hypothetical protein K2O16_06490 [Lachnospiraceae bacterium]|nr:hypothetical protein [Lachnospiraceae bacterium]MDE7331879.1 hypothetical protein [Lachnospiraceae bacterium]
MKKIMIGFAVFLIAMMMCTVISRSIYAHRLPMVGTCQPESKYVEHKVEAEGIVVAGGEKTVTYLPGLRIDAMPVHAGDRVEEGDILFQIDLEDLGKMIEDKRTEISKVSLQIDAILENQAIAQQKKELELARAREDYDTTARIQDTQVGRATESYSQAQEDLEENGGDESLKDALQSAAYEEADAKAQRDEAVKLAGRKVEDILLPDNAASDLEVAQVEKASLWADMQELQKIVDSQGIVKAPFGGVITEILAGVGDRVPDTAVLLISDESLPCQLKVTLDKEQKKYISLGDEVSVKIEGAGRALEDKIGYLAESRTAPEKYEALIELPQNTGVPGASGTIARSENGEKHKCCIPVTALNTQEDRNYVYVLKEREGILGQEYYVDEMNVKVIDKNENWAALEEGTLDKDSKVVISSTMEIKKGDVVRWEQ